MGCIRTPGNRKKYAEMCEKKHPEYAEKIRKACPVLCGKQSACDGCQWDGVQCFDCRGFTHWLLEQVGLDLYGEGATTQYSHGGNWAVQFKTAFAVEDVRIYDSALSDSDAEALYNDLAETDANET